MCSQITSPDSENTIFYYVESESHGINLGICSNAQWFSVSTTSWMAIPSYGFPQGILFKAEVPNVVFVLLPSTVLSQLMLNYYFSAWHHLQKYPVLSQCLFKLVFFSSGYARQNLPLFTCSEEFWPSLVATSHADRKLLSEQFEISAIAPMGRQHFWGRHNIPYQIKQTRFWSHRVWSQKSQTDRTNFVLSID